MLRMLRILIVVGLFSPQIATAGDPLTEMFAWWNQAFIKTDGFSEQAFAEHWTEDAELIVDGQLSARGIPELTRHFQRIQTKVDSVQIILPFELQFQKNNQIFTWHYIRSEVDGKPRCSQAMGYAEIRNNRVARIHLTRTVLETPVSACQIY